MEWRWSRYPAYGATALIPLATWLVVIEEPSGLAQTAVPGREIVVEPGRVGSASCSGRGCHGKVAVQGTEGSEFNTWANLDPHARAYLTLFDCRSESIQRNLNRGRPDADQVPAYEDARCMSCHGRPESMEAVRGIGPVDCEESGSLALAIGASGVGCEDCHGPAESWLDLHYREGWPGRYPEAAAMMKPLGPTADRARACLTCHVGSGLGQEVNHDLIAAGHPRLNFELASHSDRMPRHWDQEVTDAERLSLALPARDEAGEWAVGQVATLRASLGLLAERSGAARDRDHPEAPPWPEFSEYACFSCHHALADRGLHYSRGDDVPGSMAWASWALPMSRVLIDRLKPELFGPLDSIERRMREPYPEPDRIAEEAARLGDQLDRWLATFDEGAFGRPDLHALLASIAADTAEFGRLTTNWDSSAQLYLAARAMMHAEAGRLSGQGRIRPEDLDRLRGLHQALQSAGAALAFPSDDLDSPGSRGEPTPWSEPPGSIVESIETLLQRLRESPADDDQPAVPPGAD